MIHALRSIAFGGVVWALAFAASPLHAQLAEKVFGGKKEAEVVKEFTDSILRGMADWCKQPVPPRTVITVNKREVVVQVHDVKGDQVMLLEMCRRRWSDSFKSEEAQRRYTWDYEPHEPTHTFKFADLPAASVLLFVDLKLADFHTLLRCAFYAAAGKNPWLANECMARAITRDANQRADIEDWVCALHGWKKPAGGLKVVDTHDLEQRRDGVLLLTPEAEAARLKTLDKDAAAKLKEIEAARGDSKGGIFQRRKPPTERLDALWDRVNRFEKAFAGTPFVANKANKKKLTDLLAGLDKDRKDLSEAAYAADRLGRGSPSEKEAKWVECGRRFEQLYRAEPANHEWLQFAADAYIKASEISHGGDKTENVEACKRALALYDELCREYPRTITFFVARGLCQQATGDKVKAKASYQYAVDKGKADDANVELAKKQLEYLNKK